MNNEELESYLYEQQAVNNYYSLSDDKIAELFFLINDAHNAHCNTCNETHMIADNGLTLAFALFARLGYLK